jgi:hypothetical protein
LERIAVLNHDHATSEVVLNALKKEKFDHCGFGKLLRRDIVGVKFGGKTWWQDSEHQWRPLALKAFAHQKREQIVPM